MKNLGRILGALVLVASLGVIGVIGIALQDNQAPEETSAYVKDIVTLYVSPNGDDANPGNDISAPLKTITEAQSRVRDLTSNGTNHLFNVHVYIREGEYRLTEPIVFDTRDNAGDDTYVVYEKYPGEEVIINGGIELPAAWTNVGGDIWEITFDDIQASSQTRIDFPTIRFLMKEGDWTHSTIFPTTGPLRLQTVSADEKSIVLEAPAGLNPPQTTASSEILSVHKWTVSQVNVASQNGYAFNLLERMTPEHYTWNNAAAQNNSDTPGTRVFIRNFKVEDSVPGMWEIDHVTRKIRYKSLPGEQPNNLSFEIPVADQLFVVKGTRDNPVKNVHFTGLNFTNTTGFQDAGYPYQGIQGGYFYPVRSPKAAVHFEFAETSSVSYSRFYNIGGMGVEAFERFKDIFITNNQFTHIASTCVMVGKGFEAPMYGQDPNDPDIALPQERTGVIVRENEITKCGHYLGDGVGIFQSHSLGTQITNNHVYDLPYTGISVGFSYKPDLVYQGDNNVSNNLIHDVTQFLCDGGGIYTAGANPNSRIVDNIIYNVRRVAGEDPCPPESAPNWSIFFDNSSWGFTATGNGLASNLLLPDGGNTFYLLTGPENMTAVNNYDYNIPDELWKRVGLVNSQAGSGRSAFDSQKQSTVDVSTQLLISAQRQDNSVPVESSHVATETVTKRVAQKFDRDAEQSQADTQLFTTLEESVPVITQLPIPTDIAQLSGTATPVPTVVAQNAPSPTPFVPPQDPAPQQEAEQRSEDYSSDMVTAEAVAQETKTYETEIATNLDESTAQETLPVTGDETQSDSAQNDTKSGTISTPVGDIDQTTVIVAGIVAIVSSALGLLVLVTKK